MMKHQPPEQDIRALRFSLAQQIGATRFKTSATPSLGERTKGLETKLEANAISRDALDPRAVLTAIGEVVYTWDLIGDTMTWGANVAEVLGKSGSEMDKGRAFASFVEPGSGRSPHEVIIETGVKDPGTGVAYSTTYHLRLKSDSIFIVEDTGRWFGDMNGTPVKAHGALRVEQLTNEEFQKRNNTDTSDRSHFLAQMNEALHEALRANRHVALLVLGIKDLNTLNDELGEEVGDEFIDLIAQRISSVMRKRDQLVRYAGNRHAALLVSCPRDQVEQAAQRIINAVAGKPFETRIGAASSSVCIGAAVAPDHGTDAAVLLRRAEEALRETKEHSSKAFAIYEANAERDEQRRQRGAASHEIVSALNEKRLLIALQPVVDARTRQIIFSEGMIRMRRVDGTIVGASEIVPAVERLGLVRLVDYRVLELAVEYLEKHPTESLSVNISPVTLNDNAWLDSLAAHLGASPGIAERLIVEILETAAIDDPHAMRAKLDCMKALGVKIAIDDFGAGHTSFRHLRGFPIDILKIDGAFIQNLSRSSDDRFFVRTLVDLAQHLGVATVGEWVESEETARQLTEWGIDYLQGDAIGRPAIPHAEADFARTMPEVSKLLAQKL
jgi:diguanylate cyclase (GGDEF)-like protein